MLDFSNQSGYQCWRKFIVMRLNFWANMFQYVFNHYKAKKVANPPIFRSCNGINKVFRFSIKLKYATKMLSFVSVETPIMH